MGLYNFTLELPVYQCYPFNGVSKIFDLNCTRKQVFDPVEVNWTLNFNDAGEKVLQEMNETKRNQILKDKEIFYAKPTEALHMQGTWGELTEKDPSTEANGYAKIYVAGKDINYATPM